MSFGNKLITNTILLLCLCVPTVCAFQLPCFINSSQNFTGIIIRFCTKTILTIHNTLTVGINQCLHVFLSEPMLFNSPNDDLWNFQLVLNAISEDKWLRPMPTYNAETYFLVTLNHSSPFNWTCNVCKALFRYVKQFKAN